MGRLSRPPSHQAIAVARRTVASPTARVMLRVAVAAAVTSLIGMLTTSVHVSAGPTATGTAT